MQDAVRFSPLAKAGLDSDQQLVEAAEVEIVGCQTTGELPDPLDWGELEGVGRQEQQFEMRLTGLEQRLEVFGVVVACIVENDHHLPVA